LHSLTLAASNGRLEIVQWILSLPEIKNNPGISAAVIESMTAAASNGHLNLLKWIYDKTRIQCTDDAMLWAATNGHLDIVKWLYTKGMEGDMTSAMVWAESHKHYEVVDWLRNPKYEVCTIYNPSSPTIMQKITLAFNNIKELKW